MTEPKESGVPTISLDVRERLVEALKLDLVGPWPGHALADERLPGWERPSSRYLTGFLIPSATAPEKKGDDDEDDELGEVPAAAGPAEESNEERKAAKKGFFPSSMGLSFLVDSKSRAISVAVRWREYATVGISEADGKPGSVWQRTPREESVDIELVGPDDDSIVRPVPRSDGLELQIVKRSIDAADLEAHLPKGTHSVSVFLVNQRKPLEDEPDRGHAFQPQLEVKGDRPFVPRPDLRGVRLEDPDEQLSDLHYADTPEYATGHGVSAEWNITAGAMRPT